MTVVATFLCTDGVVVAADSMLTSSVSGIQVAHHTGKKIKILRENQVFAFAGDMGLGERFQIMADEMHTNIAQHNHPIDYPLRLTESILNQFQATRVGNINSVNTVLAYVHGNKHYCCIFENSIQPRLLDNNHFYYSLGIGKLSADPFLRFLVDIFCQDGLPNVRKGVFLATWAIRYVIQTIPGGVAGPIRIGTLECNQQGNYLARELPENEIDEHSQAIDSACTAIRKWRDSVETGAAAEGTSQPPKVEG